MVYQYVELKEWGLSDYTFNLGRFPADLVEQVTSISALRKLPDILLNYSCMIGFSFFTSEGLKLSTKWKEGKIAPCGLMISEGWHASRCSDNFRNGKCRCPVMAGNIGARLWPEMYNKANRKLPIGKLLIDLRMLSQENKLRDN